MHRRNPPGPELLRSGTAIVLRSSSICWVAEAELLLADFHQQRPELGFFGDCVGGQRLELDGAEIGIERAFWQVSKQNAPPSTCNRPARRDPTSPRRADNRLLVERGDVDDLRLMQDRNGARFSQFGADASSTNGRAIRGSRLTTNRPARGSGLSGRAKAFIALFHVAQRT